MRDDDANVLPMYKQMSVEVLERRILILRERGSKRDQQLEIPRILEELNSRQAQ